MEKPLNFLHPLLERFVVLMSNHTSRNQRVNDARKVLSICAEGKNPLTMYYFSTPRELPTKIDIVEDSALNGEDQGNHKSQMRGSLYAPP